MANLSFKERIQQIDELADAERMMAWWEMQAEKKPHWPLAHRMAATYRADYEQLLAKYGESGRVSVAA
jgi:hypothetical protein